MASTLDIIIVNWNTGRRLRECLVSVAAALTDGFVLDRVVVVDNASSDGSANDLDFPGLRLAVIRNGDNRGFGAACNQAAAGSRSDYLLFLNPDTRLLSDTLLRSVQCMEAAAHSQTGILGVQLMDEESVARSCARFPNALRIAYMAFGLHRLFPGLFRDHFYVEWDHLQSVYIDQVMGAYFFVRGSVFRQVAGFDERFFLYFEEVDLTLRARLAGWATYYLATAQCYHVGGGSSHQAKPERLFYFLRSRLLYAFKNFGTGGAIISLLVTLFVEPFSRLVEATASGSISRVTEIVRGYLLLWRALPGILASDYAKKPAPLKAHGGEL